MNGLIGKVEIISECDNKQISIGLKRQKLLERATGEFICFLDDDDMPYDNYLRNIVSVIENNPGIDCIGIAIDMTTNGKNEQRCCHSLKYRKWKNNVDGWDYVRNITHFNPVRRDLALKVGFQDLRFGEDKLYSDAVTKLCKKEVYITEPVFHYRYSNKQSHQKKYGFIRG
jgi:glycosyltransferase involved in cell wall biosynthesis